MKRLSPWYHHSEWEGRKGLKNARIFAASLREPGMHQVRRARVRRVVSYKVEYRVDWDLTRS